MDQPAKDVTTILRAIGEPDTAAAAELLPLVYEELRKLAANRLVHEPPDLTLQATALVHEAYVRLVGDRDVPWDGRGHFCAAAAEAMRRILVEQARKRGRIKRGGDRKQVPLEVADPAADHKNPDMVSLDEALRRMERQDPRMHEVVMLRYFAGLSLEDTAAALDISTRTVKRDWQCARAWLYEALNSGTDGD